MADRAPDVLGIDLSLTAAGIALPDGTTSTITTTPTDGDHVERIRRIRNAVIRHAMNADLVVLEDIAIGAKGSAVHALAGLAYATRLELRHIGAPYAIVGAGQLKKYATGKGNANKTAMALALQARADLVLADDNQTDAWWLRAMGHHALGHPLIGLPKTHIDVLANIDWPAPRNTR